MGDAPMVWVVLQRIQEWDGPRYGRPHVAYRTLQAAQAEILAELPRWGLAPTRWMRCGPGGAGRAMRTIYANLPIEWQAWALPLVDVPQRHEQDDDEQEHDERAPAVIAPVAAGVPVAPEHGGTEEQE